MTVYLYFQKVFFVDFGNVEIVSSKDIRTMLGQFMHCPFQAYECCLSNLVCTSRYSKSPVRCREAK